MNFTQSTSPLRNCILILVIPLLLAGCGHQDPGKRLELDLNGDWELAKSASPEDIPANFPSSIPVPGLVDMASPTLDTQDTAYKDAVYWYKRSFRIGETEVASLKINMAKYHTRVFLNGSYVGENLYNFTPGYFNLKPYLNEAGKDNVLLISVACQNMLPDTVMGGHDFEKTKYIPGIYDDVKLIATGYPYISGVQTAPNIEDGSVRIQAQIETGPAGEAAKLHYRIKSLDSGKVVAEGDIEQNEHQKKQIITLDFQASLSEVHLWSPEDPFLYTLELSTEGDQCSTRFGMRSFTSNPDGGAYLLNGRPYFMRGTNVCILRSALIKSRYSMV